MIEYMLCITSYRTIRLSTLWTSRLTITRIWSTKHCNINTTKHRSVVDSSTIVTLFRLMDDQDVFLLLLYARWNKTCKHSTSIYLQITSIASNNQHLTQSIGLSQGLFDEHFQIIIQDYTSEDRAEMSYLR